MVSGGLRALPTLGLLTLFALWLGIGLQAPVIALVILALPPLLAVAYAGLESVDRRTVDAARAMGMREGQIVARPMMYLALSYDHRLIDGREAVTFLVRVKEAIEDPTRLLIDL